jgi:hypothetical protein
MRIVNRGFTQTLLVLVVVAELALCGAASAPPNVVRIFYGTTLAMYMKVAERLQTAAPDVRVLAMGDSLAMTQFQPNTFAADHGLPANAVFNASYLAQTFRSQENLLRHLGIERFARLRQVLLFINPRRLTPDGNEDAAVFRIAIPEPGGPWPSAWQDKSLSPILDYSHLYGLSKYLVTASWRQIGRPASWDAVEYMTPQGGVAFDRPRPAGDVPVYLFEQVDAISEESVADLKRVIDLFRARNVSVVLLPSAHHPSVQGFANASAEARFTARMQQLAGETGSVWVPIPAGSFQPPADTDYLDYGHLNRSGGIAFTHVLREAIPPIE